MTEGLSAQEVIGAIADGGIFESWDRPPDFDGVSDEYRETLRRAALRSGTDEAVVTGAAHVGGVRFALVVSEFGFLGGSIGHATADRVVAAIRRATAQRLPVLTLPASGGTRMQEGASAFYRMVELSRAVNDHTAEGLLHVSYLRHPTTGGVYASWASQGQVTWADPAALVTLLGPKVLEAIGQSGMSDHIQRGAHLASAGVVDAAFALESLADAASRVARVCDAASFTSVETPDPIASADLAGQVRSRFGDVVRVSGSRFGDRETGARLHLGRLDGQGWVIFSQSSGSDDMTGTSIEDLRLARRGMGIAQSLELGFLSLVDTAGADLSTEIQSQAMAREISATIGQMTACAAPTAAVLLDRGCGGAALSVLGAARVAAVEGAWLSPLPPAGAGAILFGDPTRTEEAAAVQRIDARELCQDGVVERVIARDDTLHHTAAAIVAWLQEG